MKRFLILGLGGCLALLAGCATPPSSVIRPLSDAELRAFFNGARDPRRFWITVYQTGAGPVFAGANRIHADQLARLPFQSFSQPKAPLITLEAERGEPFLGLVDTSSAESWLDLRTAAKARVIPLSPPYGAVPGHVADEIAGYACVASRLRFQYLRVETVVVYARAAHGPLGMLGRGETKPPPQGVLGCNLLSVFQFVQVDYPNRAVVLSSTADYRPDPTNLVAAVELLDAEGAYAVRGTINGEPQVIILDTAGDYSVAMASPPEVILNQVTAGDLVFRKVEAVSSRDCGLGLPGRPRIGRHLLSRFRVTFVPARRLVYFERPESASR